ncbi:MAG: aminoacyl-histidine dipeptidase [Candidatus Cloacimonetes bacterium]|nr:aminoacyl-histidine dipeptidase [Candidatus Cloacimonadota bacterium]
MEIVIGKFLTIFKEISAIPRCSKHEEAICKWLCDWAEEHKFACKQDKAGNIVITVPATPGYEDSPIVVLQGHTDMVCEKLPESDHDFATDAIRPIRQGDWLVADKTTLGADNGVAIALALMLVEEQKPHPQLELLFTVDEETGLTGANQLGKDFLQGKILLNLDSEGEGKFTIGCAGGKHTIIHLPLEYDLAAESSNFLKLKVHGLLGGHSGVDINKNHGSALKLLARSLYLLKEEFSFNIADILGGTAHNAISRDAECTICIYPDDQAAIEEFVETIKLAFRHEYTGIEPGLEITIEPEDSIKDILTEESTLQVINLLMALPHGVSAMTLSIPDLVETSCNLAKVEIESDSLRVLISIRSSVSSRLEGLCGRIISIGDLAGAEVEESDGYPAWEPDTNSDLLKLCTSCYQKLFGIEPDVLIIHAGLECGLIGEKYPDMEMISFRPTIQNAHSPRERLNLPSFQRTWEFLAILLEEMR